VPNRSIRRLAVFAAASAFATTLAFVVPPVTPAAASGIQLRQSTKIKITRGVQRWSISWHNDHGYQHGYVMSVDLTVKGLSIRPGVGHGMVNDREPTTGIAARSKAVGGINGDLFNWDTALPWGGVGINGGVYKSPKQGRPSQFYVTAAGKAGIGEVKWSGSLTQVSRKGKLGASRGIVAVNTLGLANKGYLTLFTPAITSQRLHNCAAVIGSLDSRTLTVHRVYKRLTRFRQLTSGHRMLAACGTSGQWLLNHAQVGQRLRIKQQLTNKGGTRVTSFISGERTLRMHGRVYRDKTGFHTNGINPETAACVSRDRQQVLLIAVDGWIGWAGEGNGITLPELGDLTAALHCYSAVVFDGGGSTTMVVKQAGKMHIINRMPSHYGQRPVPNALLVFKS
jgi:hypothetical protein